MRAPDDTLVVPPDAYTLAVLPDDTLVVPPG